MLLWERLSKPTGGTGTEAGTEDQRPLRTYRLPYDKQCAAITKSGRRCRGKIRKDADFCPFHDPSLIAKRRRNGAAKNGPRHHRLTHIPGGYLRKLNSRQAVGQAMDRLYRELRLELVTTEMATVLFAILTRLLDSDFCPSKSVANGRSGRSKADRLRPKINELLTHSERTAWRKAATHAPESFLHPKPQAVPDEPKRQRPSKTGTRNGKARPALSAAS